MELNERELQLVTEIIGMVYKEIIKYVPFPKPVIGLITYDLNEQLIKKYGIKIDL